MGFIRQSKIAGVQLGNYMTKKGFKDIPRVSKREYAGWVAEEARDQSKKNARKAKMYRALGMASKHVRELFNLK
jgi:hypothetical protein